MKHPDSYRSFVAVLRDALTFELPDGAASAAFTEIGLDSLDVLEIVVTLDDLGVRLDDDELASLETLGDLHRAFERATTVTSLTR